MIRLILFAVLFAISASTLAREADPLWWFGLPAYNEEEQGP